jgi:hypothetical protein
MRQKPPLRMVVSLTFAVLIMFSAHASAQQLEPTTAQAALGTGFIYQGELTDADGPVTGTCDLRFSLYDAANNGDQQGSTQTINGVSIEDGRFSALINGGNEFGADAFMGDARWLEVAVRCPAGSGSFTVLSPRQELTATPYAHYALKANSVSWSGLTDVPADIADGDNDALGSLSCSNGQFVTWNGTTWICAALPDDNDTTYTAGNGLTLTGGAFSVAFGGDGVANSASRSDHTHMGQEWVGSSLDGLRVNNLSAQAFASGITAISSSTTGTGLKGFNFLSSGGTRGVAGEVRSPDGVGVYGHARATSGITFGVTGVADSTSGTGVIGVVTTTVGEAWGVYGATLSSSGYGVSGVALATTGENVGVYGGTASPAGWAGYFDGDVGVNGTVYKNAGGFRIDHPLDPENKYLNHSFVESPDMMNMYNGNVILDSNGEAWVQLPDWFEVLNRDFRYQLTPIGAPGPNLYIAEPIQNNQFKIAGGTAGLTVSWQVTGIRQDPYAEAHRIAVEEDKGENKGTYITPEGYGQPAESSTRFKRWQDAEYQAEPAAQLLEHMKAHDTEPAGE